MNESRMLSGDEVMAFATAVYNKMFNRCNGYKDDLIMEGVVGILTYKDKYNEELGSFSNYMWSCAYGKMLSFYRKVKKQKEICVEMGDFESEVADENIVEIGKIVSDKPKLIQCIRSKNELQHKIINDMFENSTQSEVAEKNKVSRQYVSSVWNNFCKIVRDNYELIDGELVEKGVVTDV